MREAARALGDSPVYVAPGADPGLTRQQVGVLESQIRERGAGPFYVAVLDGSDVDDPNAALKDLHDRAGRRGTYVLVAGTELRAGSDLLNVGPLATAAVRESGPDGLSAILLDLVGRVGDTRAGSAGNLPGEPQGGGIGGGTVLLIGIVAIVGATLLLRSRGRSGAGRRRAAALPEGATFEEARDDVRDQLVALGDEVRALDLDVEMPNAPPAARERLGTALAAYDRANRAYETARAPEDLEPVGSALEEARWALAAARAQLAGEPEPERRPPCFFDPRHGPSSRDVEWAPPGGAPRDVPACEADAQRVERGEDPEAREVLVGGRRRPYWDAGPAYAPFAGGMWGSGLFPGLAIGTLLGSAWDAPAWGDAGDFGDVGGGDFGGGGFGGGDFGGGGGDFGGGSF